MDRIELSGIRVVGRIGVLPEERERSQPFEVDLVIDTDVHRAGETDDLSATVNYAIPIEMVERVIEGEQHQLLERVATRITEEVLTLENVLGVEVFIRKLRPPVPHDVDWTGVRIHRSRES